MSLPEAILGAKIRVPTATGSVTMTIPPHSNSGTVLRLKGKGLPKSGQSGPGDQRVGLKVVLPEKPDAELSEFIRSWSEDHAYDARANLEG